MLRWLLRRRIARFERVWDYDSSYLREILEASPNAFLKLVLAAPLQRHRKDVPPAVYAAAGITAVRAADCGPCYQLAFKMAIRAGMPPPVAEAIVTGDRSSMGTDAALGYAFARSVLERDAVEADRLRALILERWGDRALVSLGFLIASAGFYPTLRHAMGSGKPVEDELEHAGGFGREAR